MLENQIRLKVNDDHYSKQNYNRATVNKIKIKYF